MKKKFILDAIILLLIGGIFFLGSRVVKRVLEDRSLNHTYQELRKNTESGGESKKINWEKLKKINPDIVGWIYVKDTPIDYPVVKGNSNQEYLHQDFYKKYSYGGCVFADAKCDISSSQNVVIYGHHMRNGSMFASLTKFRDSHFAKTHKIFFYTPEKTYQLNVFSAYAMEEVPSLPINFSSKENLIQYTQELVSKSDVSAKEERVTRKDHRIFTFVTCSYEGDNYRVYVHSS